jgi:7-cyano-7-deazaguanine synthase
MNTAVVLVSGGIDSTVLLALSCWSYDRVVGLHVTYGQRALPNELDAARSICRAGGIELRCVTVDPALWKQVPLCGADGLPLDRNPTAIRDGGIPRSFVPGRNVVFLAHGIALAGILGGATVLFGATATDASGYPDCGADFVRAMAAVSLTALPEQPTTVRAPLLWLAKRQVVALGRSLAVDFDATWSCYSPVRLGACGRCDACVLRAEALAP